MTIARLALRHPQTLRAQLAPAANTAAHPLPLQIAQHAAPVLPSIHGSLAALHIASLPPGASLACFSALCNFTLEVSLAYLLCWSLARFATSPGLRFSLWTTLLLAAAAAWLATLAGLAGIALHVSPLAATTHAQQGAHIWNHTSNHIWNHNWTVPQPFAQRIGLALTALALLYAAVLVRLGLVALLRRRRLAQALAFRSPAPAPAQALFASLCAEMHVPLCTLWLLPGLPSPATLGSRRPSVYLPPECLTEDPAALADILRHELAHVHRRDALWEALARICRALVFFHPALHRAFAASRLERELAADRIVIRTRPDTRDLYADTLVRFGWRTTRHPNTIGISFSTGTSMLHARVQSILAGEPFYSTASRRLRGLLSAAASVLFTLAAPALWVGFHLSSLPASSLANFGSTSTLPALQPPVQLTPVLHPRRPAQLFTRSIPAAFPPVEPTEPQAAQTPDLPNLTPAALPDVRYRSPRPPAPLTTGNGSDSPSAQPSGPTIPSGTRGLGVSSTAVVTAAVNAVVALGRMGLGDHDHDHD